MSVNPMGGHGACGGSSSSYREEGAEQLATGNIELGDPVRAARRVIYGDESLSKP